MKMEYFWYDKTVRWQRCCLCSTEQQNVVIKCILLQWVYCSSTGGSGTGSSSSSSNSSGISNVVLVVVVVVLVVVMVAVVVVVT